MRFDQQRITPSDRHQIQSVVNIGDDRVEMFGSSLGAQQ
jgi:hypothetical protein